MKNKMFKSLSTLALGLAMSPLIAQAQLRITEVYPSGSANGTYAADWFELSNFGLTSVDLTGWKVDDNSFSFATAVAVRGVTTINPGQSIVFLEGNATGTTDASINAAFVTAWFGGNAPGGLTLANYGGSGVGLSSTADGVSLFDSLGNLQAKISFGATTAGFTFDNAAGLDDTTITQQSVNGINGAFVSFNAAEVGSPGVVPEPSSLGLLALGSVAAFAARARRR